MKKSIYSIAILAAGLLAASCGNKQTPPPSVTAVEQAEAAEQLPEVKTTIDKNSFTVALPDGWQAMPGDDEDGGKESTIVFKGKDVTELMTAAFMMINVGDDEGKTLDEGIKEFLEESKAQPAEDVKIGGKTYKTFTLVEDSVESPMLVTQENNKFISFIVGKASVQDPEVRAIINSFRLK